MDLTKEQKRNRLIFYIIIVFLAILYILIRYDFFGQTKKSTPRIEDAISLSHDISYALFVDNSYRVTHDYDLDEIFTADAREKFQVFIDQSSREEWKTKALKLFEEKKDIRDMIYLPKWQDLELSILMRSMDDASVGIAFVYIDPPVVFSGSTTTLQFPVAKIRDNENMSFFVELRYELYQDNRIGAVVLDKVFNFTPSRAVYTILHTIFRLVGNCLDGSCRVASTIPSSLNRPYSKTRGHWVVSDYDYSYNLKDYYNWLLEEEENYIEE